MTALVTSSAEIGVVVVSHVAKRGDVAQGKLKMDLK
jgi:hypothetical protein